MKSKKVLSLLLSIAVLGSTLPTAALAVDDTATTGDKTVPGWVDENNGHPKQIQKTFDFVQNNIAYSIVDGGVEVSPWYWEWDHSCVDEDTKQPIHTETVFCGSEYTNNTITIPAAVTYGGQKYNVVGIGDSAFWNATGYTVSFPENSEHFTYIGDQVFFQTSPRMESITIPASVTHIGKKSFYEDISVTIPANSQLQVIGDEAFAYNSAITTLDLPDTLTTIGSLAFSNCTSLTSITIPASVTTMEAETFDGFYDPNANGGAGNVSFADGCIFKIQDGVFYDDENLIRVLDWQENVVVPEGIKYIGAGAFDTRKVTDEATTLKSISFPSTLESIGKDAFLGNKSLEEIVIPESVTEIDSGAFQQCTGLKKVDINANLSTLSSALFNECSSLAEVELPNTVKTIELQAFNGCKGLTDIILPTGLETIGNRAFFQCTSLKTVVIPDGVTTISDKVFGNCKSIETVILPASVETVGKQAFQGAFNSESATFIMLGDNPPSNFNENALGTNANNRPNEANFTVIIPAGSEAAYAANTVFGDYVTQDDEGGTKPGISYSLSIPESVRVNAGSTATVPVTCVLPANADLTVTSSNEAIAKATLSADKKTLTVRGISSGTATITVTMTLKGAKVTAETCKVQVTPSVPYYAITVAPADNGTVTCYARSAAKGATVTVNVKPDVGYQLDKLVVTDAKGNIIEVKQESYGTYTFVMPGSKVTVEGVFVKTTPETLPFTDVKPTDWFYNSVKYVYDNGLMNGVENNLFAPNATLNRAMMVTILYRLDGQPAVSGDVSFTDVPAGTWYTNAVKWASDNGIVNGMEGNQFAPNGDLTREQMAAILYRYAEYKKLDVSASADLTAFVDGDKTSAWAADAMKWAVGSELINGLEGNTLAPQGTSTRAQVAAVLMRFCENIVK